MMHAVRTWAFFFALFSSSAGPAIAEVERVNYFSLAEAAYVGGQHVLARQYLEAGLRQGNYGPPQVAHAHRIRGLVAVAQNQPGEAELEFRLSLLIAEDQATPPELDADWTRRFESFRQRSGPPLHLHVRHGPVDASQPLPMRITTVAAPAGYIGSYWMTVKVGTFPAWTQHAYIGRDQPVIPPHAWRGEREITLEVWAADQYGNVVVGTSVVITAP